MRRHVHGWTIIRNAAALQRWLDRQYVNYPGTPPKKFPFVAQWRFASDENITAVYLTKEQLAEMWQALIDANE